MKIEDPRELFEQGVALFNRGEFFECHERLEAVWTPTSAPDRRFLQALIHFAVGFHHCRRENRTGAARQLRKGLEKIEDYLPEWDGVKTAPIAAAVGRCLETIEAGGRIEDFPKIERSGPYPGPKTGWPILGD